MITLNYVHAPIFEIAISLECLKDRFPVGIEISKELASQLSIQECNGMISSDVQYVKVDRTLPYNSFLIRELSLTNKSKNG